jgi:putative oxidoreductase
MNRSYRSNVPLRVDIALLILRLWVSTSLFYKHGLEKVLHFQTMATHFPDPIGVGARFGLVYALLSDAICSVLVAIGLVTRLAAFLVVVNMAVIFIFMHHGSFVEDHAELVYVYLGAFLTLVLAGPGKFSIDARL